MKPKHAIFNNVPPEALELIKSASGKSMLSFNVRNSKPEEIETSKPAAKMLPIVTFPDSPTQAWTLERFVAAFQKA